MSEPTRRAGCSERAGDARSLCNVCASILFLQFIILFSGAGRFFFFFFPRGGRRRQQAEGGDEDTQ